MKVSELFEAVPVDMTGKKHKGCGGTYKETSVQDDINGVLHCSKCGHKVDRYLKEEATEPDDQHLIDAIRDNWIRTKVTQIARIIKSKIKAGEKEWQYLKGMSDSDLEDFIDDAKMQCRNQYESLNEDFDKQFEIRKTLRDDHEEFVDELVKNSKGDLKYHMVGGEAGTPGTILKTAQGKKIEIRTVRTKIGHAKHVKLAENLNEDWGSSDWHPVMKAMKSYVDQGYSIEEAAKNCADRWYQDMGWEEAEQAEPNIISRYKRLHGNKINEGMYVVKSKDGVEKRFKDDDSAEAKAWRQKIAKKAVAPKEKFTAEWWDYKAEKDHQGGNFDGVYPWSKIDRYSLDVEALSDVFDDAGFNPKHVDDFSVIGKADKKINGVDCAGVKIRVSYSFDKEDDMGVDSFISDAQNIIAVRDPKNPAKYIFAGYVN